jgi:hypothetical protein
MEISRPADSRSGEPRARKYYKLIYSGRRMLNEELQRLSNLLNAARQELGQEGLLPVSHDIEGG